MCVILCRYFIEGKCIYIWTEMWHFRRTICCTMHATDCSSSQQWNSILHCCVVLKKVALIFSCCTMAHICLESNLININIPSIPNTDLQSSCMDKYNGTMGNALSKNVPVFVLSL